MRGQKSAVPDAMPFRDKFRKAKFCDVFLKLANTRVCGYAAYEPAADFVSFAMECDSHQSCGGGPTFEVNAPWGGWNNQWDTIERSIFIVRRRSGRRHQ